MTLLELVQRFCQRQGLPSPSVVMSSQDDQILQIKALLEELLDDLVVRHNWQNVTYESTFTSVAAESQGDLSTLAPIAYYKVLNETIYDRTRKLPIFGPRSARDWAAMQAIPLTGPYYQYRVLGNQLKVFPTMPAGHTLSFEYVSRALILDSTNSDPVAKYRQTFNLDSNTFLVPDSLVLIGLRYKWKQEKGFAYSQEFEDFEARLAQEINGDGTKPRLMMDCGQPAPAPGIFVPSGNWNLS